MKQLFRGGIHPNDGKALSRGGAPVPMPAPSRVIIPMSQHIGAPCSPLVKVGDTVKLGQKIGDGEGVCSPVHASVSGTVAAVEQLPIPGGRQAVCVVIDSDGKDTPDPAIKPRASHKGLSPAELAAIVREAGICGMGGAAYPTNSKILSTAGKTETLLINACECEPYITSDDMVMCTWPEKVILAPGYWPTSSARSTPSSPSRTTSPRPSRPCAPRPRARRISRSARCPRAIPRARKSSSSSLSPARKSPPARGPARCSTLRLSTPSAAPYTRACPSRRRSSPSPARARMSRRTS